LPLSFEGSFVCSFQLSEWTLDTWLTWLQTHIYQCQSVSWLLKAVVIFFVHDSDADAKTHQWKWEYYSHRLNKTHLESSARLSWYISEMCLRHWLAQKKSLFIHITHTSYRMLSFICSLQQSESCEMSLWHSTWCIIEPVWCSAESYILMKEGNDSFEWFDSSHSSSHRIKVHLLTFIQTKQTLQQMSYWLIWTACSKVLLVFFATLVAFLLSCCIENLRVLLIIFHLSLLVQFNDLCLFLLREATSQLSYNSTHLKTHDNGQKV